MNTRDLMDYGPRERRLAAQLLLLHRSPKDLTLKLGEFVSPEFNPISKIVFLVDLNWNTALERNGRLEDWLRCECSEEGFLDQMEKGKECCKKVAIKYKSEFSIEKKLAS